MKNILLLVVTLIIMFLFGELGARLWARYVNPVQKVPDKLKFTTYPFLPYTTTPGYRDESKGIYHNRRGFRNSYEFSLPKPAHLYRIACLGGSTTYSDFDRASNEEIWTGRLEHYLNKDSTKVKVEVINASAQNYPAYLNLIDYLTRVRDLDVDMVILYEGVNELYFNGFDSSSFAHRDVFVPFDSDYAGKVYRRMNHNFFLKHSELCKRIYATLYLRRITLSNMALKTVHFYSAKNIENIKRDSLLTFTKALDGFVALSKIDQFQLIFLSQAYQLDRIEASLAYFNKSLRPENIRDYIAETVRMKNKMEEVAFLYNIPFLDMNNVLAQEARYFCRDKSDPVHFSKEGDDYFASQLCKFIQPYIPGKQR